MYVMKKFRLGFEDALEFVRSKRGVVDPNDGFVKQLQEFEKNNHNFTIANGEWEEEEAGEYMHSQSEKCIPLNFGLNKAVTSIFN